MVERTIKTSDLFVKILEIEGVEYIFGIPGEENLDFLNSIKNSSIKLILTRHEQAAGFMAATYGRLTGKIGVCLATLGPGATNFVTAAAYAQLGAMPMLMITGQKPIKKSKQGRFQIIDVVEMMKPLTKFTKQIVHGNTIPTLVRESVRIAQKERPGSVHLELPEDIAQEIIANNVCEVHKIRRPAPDPKAIAQATKLIMSAKKPLLLLGAGANRKRTSKALKRFVDNLGIPFITTQMGKGVIDERHQLFLGTASLSDKDFIHCAILDADLIINVGHDVIEKPPFFMSFGGFRVIHIDFSEASIDDVYFPQIEVVGDIANSIWQITDQVKRQDYWDFSYFFEVKTEFVNHIKTYDSDDAFPMKPQRIVADVRKTINENGIIALDNGMYKIWFSRNYKAYHSNTVLLDNALATMGAGLPSAMTACIVNPNAQVVAICGDGGFMMNSQELETAVRLKLNLTVLVLKDDAYGMIKWKQEGMGFEDFGLDYGNPNFVDYANSYGAKGHKVQSTEKFSLILKSCLEEKGVHLIEVPVDYSENHHILNVELKQLFEKLLKSRRI